jgi:hypothetical protein
MSDWIVAIIDWQSDVDELLHEGKPVDLSLRWFAWRLGMMADFGAGLLSI